MWNKTYWLALAERAVKTFAQSLAAVLVVDAVGAPLDWGQVLATAGLATLASVLTSLATNAATQNGPGIGSAETINEDFPDVDPEPEDDTEVYVDEADDDGGDLAEDSTTDEELEQPEGFSDGSTLAVDGTHPDGDSPAVRLS